MNKTKRLTSERTWFVRATFLEACTVTAPVWSFTMHSMTSSSP